MKQYSIYFITEDDTYNTKVGYSSDVDKRLESFQVGNPRDLWVSATIEGLTKQSAMSLENYLHRRFKSYNLRGEWFLKNIFAIPWFTEKFRMPRTAKINLIDIPLREKR